MFTQLPNTTWEFQRLRYSVIPVFSPGLGARILLSWLDQGTDRAFVFIAAVVRWPVSFFLFDMVQGCSNGFSSQKNTPMAPDAWVSPLLLATEVGCICNNIHGDIHFRLGASDQLHPNVITPGPSSFFSSAFFKCGFPTRPSLAAARGEVEYWGLKITSKPCHLYDAVFWLAIVPTNSLELDTGNV